MSYKINGKVYKINNVEIFAILDDKLLAVLLRLMEEIILDAERKSELQHEETRLISLIELAENNVALVERIADMSSKELTILSMFIQDNAMQVAA